jgi:hypothetical protein
MRQKQYHGKFLLKLYINETAYYSNEIYIPIHALLILLFVLFTRKLDPYDFRYIPHRVQGPPPSTPSSIL